MSIVTAAIRAMRGASKSMRGEEVLYRFYAGGSVSLVAVVGETQSETETSSGVVREKETVDFVFDADELGRTPSRNDRITWNGDTYTVVGIQGSKFFEHHDYSRTSYRVRTVWTPDEFIGQAVYGNSSGESYGTPTDEGYGGV